MTGAAVLPSGLTWEEFLPLLDQDDYTHAELIDGQVVVNTPSWLHQRVVANLIYLFKVWTRAERGRGEITTEPRVRITINRGYLPDVAWYCEARCLVAGRENVPDGPPDLAVEVLSPSTRSFDTIRKRADYARVGVRELWLIDPDEATAFILRRTQGAAPDAEFVVVADLSAADELSSPLLPGFAARVGELLER